MSELDDKFRDYYGPQKLSDEQVGDILETGRAFASSRRLVRMSFAAAAMLLVGLSLSIFMQPAQASTNERILAEVASNHCQKLKPDFKANCHRDLQLGLPECDFSLKLPEGVLTSRFEIIGGRKSTLCTRPAVQIQLRDRETDEIVTLYVAKLCKILEEADEDTSRYEGVHVQLWKDQSRIFVMARDAHTANDV